MCVCVHTYVCVYFSSLMTSLVVYLGGDQFVIWISTPLAAALLEAEQSSSVFHASCSPPGGRAALCSMLAAALLEAEQLCVPC